MRSPFGLYYVVRDGNNSLGGVHVLLQQIQKVSNKSRKSQVIQLCKLGARLSRLSLSLSSRQANVENG